MERFITQGFDSLECRDPVTMMVINVGMSVMKGIQQSNAIEAQTQAQQNQLQAQANAARYNAEVSRQNAEIVRGQTEAQLDKADREKRLRQGAARAAGGASGAGTESFGDILFSSAMQEELDLLTIQSDGLLRENSFLQSAGLDTMQSNALTSQIPLVGAAGKASQGAAMLSGLSGAVGGFSGGIGGGGGGGPENFGKAFGPSRVPVPSIKPGRF